MKLNRLEARLDPLAGILGQQEGIIMRCLSCNASLTDFETSRKALSGFYVDLCSHCYRTIKDELPSTGNPKLQHECDEDTTLFDESLDNLDELGYNNNYIDEEDN